MSPSRRQSSRRQPKGEAPESPRGGASSRRGGSSRGASSRRGGSNRSSGSKRDKASSAKQKAESGRGSARKRKEPTPTWITATIWSVLGVLVIAGVVVAVNWHSWQLSWKLDEIEAAPDEAAAMVFADEFLALTKGDHTIVEAAIRDRRGSIAIQVHLATSASDETGPLVPLLIDMAQRLPHELPDDDRVTILQAALDNWKADHAEKVRAEESTWIEWALQPKRFKVGDEPESENAQQRNADLAVATVQLMAKRRGMYNGDPASRIYRSLIRADRVLRVREAAIRALPSVIDSTSVGDGLDLIVSDVGDVVLDEASYAGSETLVSAITQAIGPSYLGNVLDLLDHPTDAVQSAAVAFLQGPKMQQIAPQQREDVARRIGAYLNRDVMNDRPLVFGEAVKATGNLRLVDAHEALFDTLGAIDAGSELAEEAAIAGARVILFVGKDGDNQSFEKADVVLADLAETIADPAAAPIAASILLRLSDIDGKQFLQLRTCLEAAVDAATNEPKAMQAVEHIASKLFAAQASVDSLRRDDPTEQIAAWREFLAEDRPNYDKIVTAERFYQEHAPRYQIAGDFANEAEWRSIADRLKEVRSNLNPWMEDTPAPLPLGVSIRRIQDLFEDLNQYYTTIKNAYRMD